MRHRHLLFVAFLLLLLVPLPDAALADSVAPPTDYTRVTEDGRYVFVMLVPKGYPTYAEKDETIRRRYPQSGLYLKDGSATPLWTVDWYAYEVKVSSDGHHLVRWGPWPTKYDYDALAVAFYEDGRETKDYRVKDLVAIPQRLPESVSHYTWRKDSSFDDSRDRLAIETLNGEQYVFDTTSGELVGGSLPSKRWQAAFEAVAVAMAWVGLVALLGLAVTMIGFSIQLVQRRPVRGWAVAAGGCAVVLVLLVVISSSETIL